MKLSVVIPTHNRAEILKICLENLSQQQGVGSAGSPPWDFEVVVVSDGSIDNTKDVVSKFQISSPNSKINLKLQIPKIHYIHQSASHQGVARNRGVEKATGDIILFIGDDIFVEPGFLKMHLDRHTENSDENVVVLGYTTWDPQLKTNSYMEFLEDSGWQFGYKFLKPKMIGQAEPYKFFYTSNISMKKSFFEKEKFNEDFKCYGWEDIELGFRLWKNHDMQIYYEPKAVAYHHHEIPESNLPKKMQAVGKSAVHFERLQPEVRVIPAGLKGRILRLVTHPLVLPIFKIFGKQTYYKFASWREFFVGVDKN